MAANAKINWKEVLAGEKAFNKTGNWMPEETLTAFKEYLVGIKGPPTTPVGGRNSFAQRCASSGP